MKNEIDNMEISMDKERLDLPLILKYLREESYWAQDRTETAFKISVEKSLCFGVYFKGRQIGFGRVVTDHAVVYYLADIFILPEFQGKGIGERLMNHILDYGELRNMRGLLTTQTARSFYKKFGFSNDNVIIQTRMMARDKNR